MIKRNLKRIIGLMLVLIIGCSSITIVSAKEQDVNWNDVLSYYPYNSWAVETGQKYQLIFLESNTRAAKRWEIANILYNIAKLNGKDNKVTFNDIQDMDSDIKDKILKVASSGIILGCDDGTFKPYNNVTRAEFATMLDRSNVLSNKSSKGKGITFDDTKNHWAKESIDNIVKNGVMSGRGDNKFSPDGTITPQEILIVMDKLVELDVIDSDKLISTMIDTFKCRQYGEKEKYIIEVMYGKFDQVQNDIKHKWPYRNYYDPTNWNEPATYQDLLYAMFFLTTGKAQLDDNMEDGTNIYDRMQTYMFDVQNMENRDEYLKENITIKNMIKAITTASSMEIHNASYWSKDYTEGSYKFVDQAKFINMKDFNYYEKTCIARCSADYKILENCSMYFPLDAPVTKYMLNYTILGMMNSFGYEKGLGMYTLAKCLNLEELKFETDESKLPHNYYEYPFIVKGVPKELYEMPVADVPYLTNYNRIECHEKYGKYTENLIWNSYKYYETILNVDYRTINIEEFANTVYIYCHTDKNEARKYAQYVIDNKIVLKGKGCAIPGTINIYDDGMAKIRVMLEFEVVHADKMESLLYGDLSIYNFSGQMQPIYYTKNKYNVYADVHISGITMFEYLGTSQDSIVEYKMYHDTLYRMINPYGDDYIFD